MSVLILALPLAVAACGDSPSGAPATGSLAIVTSTTGVDLDPDGYLLLLDADTVGAIGVDTTLYLDTLAAGPVTLALDGLAPNCFALPPNARTVQVREADTVISTFTVQCFQVFGGVRVSIEVSGEEPDPDGFTVVVDGADTAYSVSQQAVFTLTPGSHYVELQDIANNCQVSPQIRQYFEVPGGGETAVNYRVECTDLPGAIALELVTSGRDLDPDGYRLRTGATTTTLPANADTVLTGLPSDSLALELLDIAPNCDVAGGGLQPVAAVRVLPADTIPLRLQIVCGAGSALEFDGGQLAQLSDTVMPDMDSTWTVEFWFSSAGGSECGVLVGQWRAFSVGTWRDAAGRVGLSAGLFTAQGPQYATAAVIGDTSAARWRHVAVTYDRGRMTLYVDAEERWTNPGMGRSTAPNARYPLVVGAQVRDVTECSFAGRIDEVRIWDVARTAAEVKAWRDVQLPAGTPDLIGYWSFDDAAGPVAHDASGHGRDLILGTVAGSDSADPRWTAPGRP